LPCIGSVLSALDCLLEMNVAPSACRKPGVIQSMGRVGSALDNAAGAAQLDDRFRLLAEA